jgi:copper chaperone
LRTPRHHPRVLILERHLDLFSPRNTVRPSRVFETWVNASTFASIGGNGPLGVKAKQPIFKVMREHGLTHMSRSVPPHLVIYWRSEMKFAIKDEIRSDDIATIEHAINTVDADAKVKVDVETKTVSVDSWLMPEEFIVAFDDENYDVKITEW